ncbi:hypothetical protein [Methylobacterium gregans]|uniref:hypothetical protein n=1 Tax=Methylobacterium gregans TaxID=374424 RepID=UPI00360DA78F
MTATPRRKPIPPITSGIGSASSRCRRKSWAAASPVAQAEVPAVGGAGGASGTTSVTGYRSVVPEAVTVNSTSYAPGWALQGAANP